MLRVSEHHFSSVRMKGGITFQYELQNSRFRKLNMDKLIEDTHKH